MVHNTLDILGVDKTILGHEEDTSVLRRHLHGDRRKVYINIPFCERWVGCLGVNFNNV
jgi:hypothetical protein